VKAVPSLGPIKGDPRTGPGVTGRRRTAGRMIVTLASTTARKVIGPKIVDHRGRRRAISPRRRMRNLY
jgi:hypothetical protein